MKKLINVSMIYMIAALVAGVFYRELTKFNQFTGKTTLSVTHTHLFILGVFVFLLLALFIKNDKDILESSLFKKFFILYNIALPFFIIMLMTRGVVQVLNIQLSTAMNAMISGIAGISHILLALSFVLFFIILQKNLFKPNRFFYENNKAIKMNAKMICDVPVKHPYNIALGPSLIRSANLTRIPMAAKAIISN